MKFTRITVRPDVCTGKPCIRDLRFPVSRLLGLLAARQTADEILKAYPYLETADIDEALRYAASLAEDETIEIVGGSSWAIWPSRRRRSVTPAGSPSSRPSRRQRKLPTAISNVRKDYPARRCVSRVIARVAAGEPPRSWGVSVVARSNGRPSARAVIHASTDSSRYPLLRSVMHTGLGKCPA
jgi:uncharacterized protein (DUF433 family)